MIELVALSEIPKAGGTVAPGERFRCPEYVAAKYVERGEAERVTGDVGPSDTKVDGPADLKRTWESNGSWKTLSEDGVEIDTVQCTKEEADKWAAGALSVDDLK